MSGNEQSQVVDDRERGDPGDKLESLMGELRPLLFSVTHSIAPGSAEGVLERNIEEPPFADLGKVGD